MPPPPPPHPNTSKEYFTPILLGISLYVVYWNIVNIFEKHSMRKFVCRSTMFLNNRGLVREKEVFSKKILLNRLYTVCSKSLVQILDGPPVTVTL